MGAKGSVEAAKLNADNWGHLEVCIKLSLTLHQHFFSKTTGWFLYSHKPFGTTKIYLKRTRFCQETKKCSLISLSSLFFHLPALSKFPVYQSNIFVFVTNFNCFLKFIVFFVCVCDDKLLLWKFCFSWIGKFKIFFSFFLIKGPDFYLSGFCRWNFQQSSSKNDNKNGRIKCTQDLFQVEKMFCAQLWGWALIKDVTRFFRNSEFWSAKLVSRTQLPNV